MSIKKKFLIYFVIIFTVFISFSVFSIWHSVFVNKSLNEKIPNSINIIEKNSKQNTVAQLVRYDDEVLTQSARNYAFTGDKKWRERYDSFILRLDLKIKEAVELGDQSDVAIFKNIKDANTILVSLEKKAIDYVDTGDLKMAQRILDSSEYLEQKEIYRNGVEKYLLLRGVQIDSADPVSVAFLKDSEKYLSDNLKIEIYKNIIFIVISFIIIIFLFVIMFKTFMLPLDVFKKTAKKITEGNLNEKVYISNNDEIGDFARDFNKMTENLNSLYKNLDKKVAEKTKDLIDKEKELENQKSALLNVMDDMSKEKELSEKLAQDLEKFKLAVENASDQVIIADSEGVVIFGNNAVKKITGYDPQEAVGKKAGTLWKNPMPQEYYKNMWDTIKNKKEVFISEIQNKRKNGDIYTANLSISPVLNKEGDVIYFVAIEHDITKEKEIDKAKTEFVSLASHQLRTPLSSINWYTEMLLAGDAGPINDDQKKYLEEVAIGNKRMVELVDSLLNVSRLDLGTFIIEPKILNIVDLAKSVLNELKPQITERKQKVEEKYDENVGDFLADEKLLRIIFQNLLSNAVKYTPSNGSIKVEIVHLLKDANFENVKIKSNSLGIRISDNGMGIPINQKEKIFSKLFRADNARESETEGTGLGLYILKSIVDQSGGIIDFRTEENNGTTFYIVFPETGMKKKEGIKKLD